MRSYCNWLYLIIIVNLVLWLAMFGSVYAPGASGGKTIAAIGLISSLLMQHQAHYTLRRKQA